MCECGFLDQRERSFVEVYTQRKRQVASVRSHSSFVTMASAIVQQAFLSTLAPFAPPSHTSDSTAAAAVASATTTTSASVHADSATAATAVAAVPAASTDAMSVVSSSSADAAAHRRRRQRTHSQKEQENGKGDSSSDSDDDDDGDKDSKKERKRGHRRGRETEKGAAGGDSSSGGGGAGVVVEPAGPPELVALAAQIEQRQPAAKENAAAIKSLKEKLEADMNRTKRDFVRTASGFEFRFKEHEKKAPLTPALVRAALEAHFDLTEEELDEAMQSIEQTREASAELVRQLKASNPKKGGGGGGKGGRGGGGGGKKKGSSSSSNKRRRTK
jgi:uncharacterized membrane protein YgcG